MNIEAQQAALPMRRLYEAEVVEPLRMLQAERIAEAREAYQERKREIEASALPMEERLDAGRDALHEFRGAALAAYRELRPQPFGEWLRAGEELRERSREAVQRQAQSHERDRTQGRPFTTAEELVRSDPIDLGR